MYPAITLRIKITCSIRIGKRLPCPPKAKKGQKPQIVNKKNISNKPSCHERRILDQNNNTGTRSLYAGCFYKAIMPFADGFQSLQTILSPIFPAKKPGYLKKAYIWHSQSSARSALFEIRILHEAQKYGDIVSKWSLSAPGKSY